MPLSQTTEHIQKRQWTNDLRAVNKHRMNVYHTVVAVASTKQGLSAQGLRSFATNRKRARRGGSQTKMGPPSFLEKKLLHIFRCLLMIMITTFLDFIWVQGTWYNGNDYNIQNWNQV